MAKQYLWTVFTHLCFLKGVIRIFFSASILIVAPIANAISITLEPDDFGVGVALENAHVRAAYLDDPANGQSWDNAITAHDRRDIDPDYMAPTGNLIFGVFPFMVYNSPPGSNYGGLGFKFHQDVFRVTLLANSLYPPGDLAAVWRAFDIDGNQIAFGRAGGDRPPSETFAIDIQTKGIRTLILGGDDSIAAICFDNLTFEFDDDPVVTPEPNLIVLLLMGLVVIARVQLSAQPKFN